ncbi:glycosyltransferase [Clostridium saudiense]|uniref:glycosyltransferase n=1 Tax=Clostridium saudiense TaxID=1414720 RepID=UPI00266F0D80|nr:glycosyltransferase [Clostridium saudiense]
MIFVTVGTHEQSLNRLVEYIDELKEQGIIKERVVIQTGFSTYKPKHCEWKKLFSYNEMISNVQEARLVITHGGPSSFIMPLQFNKIPIVVPRQKKYDEHINDHQVEFSRKVEKIQGNIIVVEDIGKLKEIILNYDSIIKSMPIGIKSNNKKFNIEFERLIDDLFK